MKFFLFFSFIVVVVTLLLLVLFLGGLLDFSFSEKRSPFECGFYSFSSAHIPFSMIFFCISLVFIIFDVEILLLCFFPFSFVFSSLTSFYLFLVILLVFVATVYEWVKGLLLWV